MTVLTAKKLKKKKNNILNKYKKNMGQAGNLASDLYASGSEAAKAQNPDLFKPEFLGRQNAGDYTGYIDESKAGITDTLNNFNIVNADTMARRKAGLEGLNSAENTALRERAYAGVDRGRQAAMSDLLRQQSGAGLGGGANFAQQRAVARDFDTQRGQLEQGLLLENVGIKNKALADYEAANQNTYNTQFGNISALDALEARRNQIAQGVDTYNQTQYRDELATQQGAINLATASQKDIYDQLMAERAKKQAMKFMAEQEAKRIEAARGIL